MQLKERDEFIEIAKFWIVEFCSHKLCLLFCELQSPETKLAVYAKIHEEAKWLFAALTGQFYIRPMSRLQIMCADIFPRNLETNDRAYCVYIFRNCSLLRALQSRV